jgi:hypothetical protein
MILLFLICGIRRKSTLNYPKMNTRNRSRIREKEGEVISSGVGAHGMTLGNGKFGLVYRSKMSIFVAEYVTQALKGDA